MSKDKFTVRVPATTTNFGAGFDCLGMSLCLYNYIEVANSKSLEIELPKEDIGKIPQDESNLIIEAMKKAFALADHDYLPVRMKQINNIPFARGLGSSAACIAAGILAANRIMGNTLSQQQMLNLAVTMDGHPDNVTPALMGGLIAAMMDGDDVRYVRTVPSEKYKFHALIPPFELMTSKARQVLPKEYSRADCVYNIQRSTLMFASLSRGIDENLKTAVDDRLHQPYRKQLIKDYDVVINEVYNKGALAAWLSGAGPTIMVITKTDKKFDLGLPDGWLHKKLDVDEEGTIIL